MGARDEVDGDDRSWRDHGDSPGRIPGDLSLSIHPWIPESLAFPLERWHCSVITRTPAPVEPIRVSLFDLPPILRDVLWGALGGSVILNAPDSDSELRAMVRSGGVDAVIGRWPVPGEGDRVRSLLELSPRLVVVAVGSGSGGFRLYDAGDEVVLPPHVSPEELIAEVRRRCSRGDRP